MIFENEDLYKPVIYRYDYFNGHHRSARYGQGLEGIEEENYVRLALARKLEIDPAQLHAGKPVTDSNEISRVNKGMRNYRLLQKRLKLDHPRLSDATLKWTRDNSPLDSRLVNLIIAEELILDRSLFDNGIDDSLMLRQICDRYRTDQIMVRLHKYHETIAEDGQRQKTLVSRVEELRRTISMLIAHDYNIFDIGASVLEELDKAHASLRKSKKIVQDGDRPEDYVKHLARIDDLEKQISQMQGTLGVYNPSFKYNNVGYFVTDAPYEFDTYDDVLRAFDEKYIEAKSKLRSLYINDIPFNGELTFEEALDSYAACRLNATRPLLETQTT